MLKTELTHPEILDLIARCGHGDSFAIVDSNYPSHARRDKSVPLVSVNITHNVPSTPTIAGLISNTLPVESFTLPVPAGDSPTAPRPVHAEIKAAVQAGNPEAEEKHSSPADFYGLTSVPNLAFVVVTGERRHYGSVIITVGYLPES